MKNNILKNILSEKSLIWLIRLYFVSLFLLEITLLPNRVAMGLLLIYITISINKSTLKNLFKNPFLLFFIFPLIYSALFLCNSDRVTLNIIVLIMAIFFTVIKLNKTAFKEIYKTLNYSLLSLFVVCLVYTTINQLLNEGFTGYWWNNYTHKSFIQLTKLHPSYLSIFILSTIFWNFKQLLDNNFYRRRLLIFKTAGLLFFLVLIASKMALIILALLLTLLLIVTVKKGKSLTLIILGLMIIIASTIFFPSIKNRLTNDYNLIKESNFKIDNTSKVSERIFLWKTSVNIIKKTPLGNYCLNSKDVIQTINMKKNVNNDEKKNSHNNFFEFGIIYGVLGLVLMGVFSGYLFYFFYLSRDLMGFSLSLIFVLFSLVESTMVRELGVIFFSTLLQGQYLKIKHK